MPQKRFFAIVGMLLALVGVTLGLAACGGETHEHAWSEWETVTAPTCTAEGLQRRFCACGETETNPIAMLEHTPEYVEEVPASCTEDGHTAGTRCAVCHTPLGGAEIIPAGHTEVPIAEARDATCKFAGTTAGKKCYVCGEILEETQEIPIKQHTPVEFGEDREPDCRTMTDGTTKGTKCSECGEVLTPQKTVPAAHTWGDVQITKMPTCTEKGEVHAVCEVCGAKAEDEKGEVPALGHDFVYTFVRETDSDGERECFHKAVCKREDCGYEEEAEACSLDSVKTLATCTAPEHHVHTCTLCGHSYEHDEGAALGHKYSDWEFDEEAYLASLNTGTHVAVRRHKRVCANLGHVPDADDPDIVDCEGEEISVHLPDCLNAGYTDYRCEDCGKEWRGDSVALLGHDWEKNADGSLKLTPFYYEAADQWVHYKTCTRENCPAEGHRSGYYACRPETAHYVAATCTEGAKRVYTCADCRHKYDVSLGEPRQHNYSEWEHDPQTSGVDDSYHMRTCQYTDCNHVERVKCSMKTVASEATCQKVGSSVTACEVCFYTADRQTFEQLQHQYPETFVADGVHKTHSRSCERCGHVETGDCVYELDHTDEATCDTDEVQYYRCDLCSDETMIVNKNAFGHSVSEWHESADGKKHEGECSRCFETVSQEHDYTETNICPACRRDGLRYAYVSGSGNAEAMVVSDNRPGYESQGIYGPHIPAKNIIIADTWNGVPVTIVNTTAFARNTAVEQLTLPKSLRVISYEAFGGCTSLRQVRLEGHEYGEFDVDGVALKRIEELAFKGCSSLESAIFPKTLEFIGKEAFQGCAALTDINIPESVTEIDANAFTGTAFYLNDTKWTNNALYIGKHLIRVKESAQGTFAINDGIVSVSEEAFKNCAGITSVEIPASVTVFDRDAFDGCIGLRSATYHGKFEAYLAVKFLNDKASPMYYASALTIDGATGVVEIPRSATAIPAGAFRGSSVTGVVIHGGVESIGAQAFKDCESLEYIFLEGNGLRAIGADAFTGSKFYKTDSNWENGILYLKNKNGTMPADSGVAEPSLSENGYLAVVGSKDEGIGTEVTVHEGVRAIADEAFKGRAGIAKIVLPKTLVYIGAGAVEGCTALNEVQFTSSGSSWFACGTNLGRLLSESNLSADPAGAARQMKNLYIKEWKRQ